MIGVHVLIGIGEAAITALTVGAVVAVRPDLVHGARDLRQRLQLRVERRTRRGPGAGRGAHGARGGPRLAPHGVGDRAGHLPRPRRLRQLLRLRRPRRPGEGRRGPRHRQEDREARASDSPLAGYGVKDVTDARLSGGLAGVIGVGATVVAGSAVFWTVRRRRTRRRVRGLARAGSDVMGAGHAHRLYRHGHSPVHGLPPHTKLAARLRLRGRRRLDAAGGDVGVRPVRRPARRVVAHRARVPAGFLLKRLLIEVPFVAFARAACRSWPRASGSRCSGCRVSVQRAVGRLERPRQGHPRRRRLRPARRPPPSCATCCSACSGCGCRRCSCRSRPS